MSFFKNVYKYRNYIITATKANLKADVAGSYLNWLWWVLEPMGLMVMYAVLFGWLFKYSIDYFPVFIFIGNTIWSFFSSVIMASVTLMKDNEMLISRIYIPKYILLIVQMMVDGFKMLISFGLTAILMVFFRVPISINVFLILPEVIVLMVVTFGIGTLMLNWGVFIDDLNHAMRIIMMVWMYFSGIFFDIKAMVPQPASGILLIFNFPAYLIDAVRSALIRCETNNVLELVIWFLVGVLISSLGIILINKNENSYVKRM